MSETRLQGSVGALATMASTMERIVQSRAMVAIAHRSYAEGDKLLAEAERDRAEANKVQAKTDILIATHARQEKNEAYDESETARQALAALRGTASR